VEPLWKIRSGKFAGWRSGTALYDADGKNIGYFEGDVAYSLDGQYLGEICQDDWIGKQTGVSRGTRSSRGACSGVSLVRCMNRVGVPLAGWEDPAW
jgi:hypothetical protein